MTSAEAAAVHWVLNTTILKRQAKIDSGLRSLHCKHLLEDPISVFRLVRDHLQLSIGDLALEENVRNQLNIHAKNMTSRFSSELYLREMDQLKHKHSAKIRAAVNLVQRLHPTWNRPIPASLV